MRLLIVVVVVGMIGCTASPPGNNYTVYFDPAFGDKTVDVMAAFQDWEVATGDVKFHMVLERKRCDEECGYEITVSPAISEYISSICNSPNCVDVTKSEGTGVWSNIFLSPDVDYRGTRHEIGHSLGLQHTGKGSIMCADSSCAAFSITCLDVQQYYSVRGKEAPDCNQVLADVIE